jgi:UDP-N-acetylglucosamine 4,6-dehydratase
VTDALGCVEFSDYFVILPSTRLWDVEEFRKTSNGAEGRRAEYGFSYDSGTNEHFLSVEELRELIRTMHDV